MPGKPPPEPAAYVVDVPQEIGQFTTAEERAPRRIEAFPLVDGVATPQWVEIPHRRVVTHLELFAYPQGARKLPLYRPTGDPLMDQIRPGVIGGRRFLFVSEGYGDTGRQTFLTDCRRLVTRLLNTPPFADRKDSIRVDALFLPLSGGAVVDIKCGQSGEDLAKLKPALFGTQSCFTNTVERLWAGDEDWVRTLVKEALPKVVKPQETEAKIYNFDFVAVLIKSTSYGGAGSSGAMSLRPRVAWATTDHLDSLEILLHELGHAFGLQDEYEDKYEGPPKPWRNITRHREPRNTPWEELVNQNRDRLTLATGQSWPGDHKAVGTFQGAGYDSVNRYRPSHKCRMRTLGQAFCVVCSAVILAALDPTVGSRVREEH